MIHAPGGGWGHLTRALVLASALPGPVDVWHQAPAALPLAPAARVRQRRLPASRDEVVAALELAARDAPLLIADTFPRGLEGELDAAVLGAFRRRVLVKRHLKVDAYPGYERAAARFDLALLPYPPHDCEWDGATAGEHVGHLLRDLPLDDAPPAPLVVLGDPARLEPGWRALLPAAARVVNGWTARLPRGERYLSIGAGYHATHELARAGVTHGLVPLERRYDDPFRRADRRGVAVHTRADLRALLAGGVPCSS